MFWSDWGDEKLYDALIKRFICGGLLCRFQASTDELSLEARAFPTAPPLQAFVPGADHQPSNKPYSIVRGPDCLCMRGLVTGPGCP